MREVYRSGLTQLLQGPNSYAAVVDRVLVPHVKEAP